MRNLHLLITGFLLLTCFNLQGQQDSTSTLARFAPDHYRLQFAGNIGMLSVGPSWNILKERVEVNTSYGLVLTSYSQSLIHILSGKVLYSPPWLLKKKHFDWQPLSVGAVATYSMGDMFKKYSDGATFPEGYYWWGVRTSWALSFDTEVDFELKKGPFSSISLYLEYSLWDFYVFNFVTKGNSKYLEFDDITVLGTGLKFNMK